MEIPKSLQTVLRRLKLSGLCPTLPDRVAYARKAKLPELEFLELVLQDEIDRRNAKNVSVRLEQAGFEDEQTLEGFDWNAPVTFDRDRVRDLFSLGFLERQEDVIFVGPVGVGKTFLACALGHAACRAGRRVLFLRADRMFHLLHQSRADLSTEKVFRQLLAPDLLIVDDFALRRLTSEQSNDLYEVLLERHRRASTIVTVNQTEYSTSNVLLDSGECSRYRCAGLAGPWGVGPWTDLRRRRSTPSPWRQRPSRLRRPARPRGRPWLRISANR